jgi:hypothetical protein
MGDVKAVALDLLSTTIALDRTKQFHGILMLALDQLLLPQ